MLDKTRLQSFFDQVATKKILVVGDLIVDRYRFLTPHRLNPEAPTIIFRPSREEYRLGGAGNVLSNLTALGTKASLATVVGSDWEKIAFHFPTLEGSLLVRADRTTTVKERLITDRQQLLRIDIQGGGPIENGVADKLFGDIANVLADADAVIMSDYDHGVMIPELVGPLMDFCRRKNKPVIVDSKARDTISKYRDATIILPNVEEAKLISGLEEFDDKDVANFLLRHMKLAAVAITLGPRGILLATKDGQETFPALQHDDEVADVTGAGDTVAAMVAACLSAGVRYNEAIELANVAAGIKVRKRGVATVSVAEIMETIHER